MATTINRVITSAGEYPSVYFYGDSLTSSGSVTMTGNGQTYNAVWKTKQTLNPEWVGLPSGYQQVEYISNPAKTQYIDTAYKPSDTTRIVFDFYGENISGDVALFGERSTTSSSVNASFSYWLCYGGNNTYNSVDYGSNNVAGTTLSQQFVVNNRYVLDFNQNKLYKDDVLFYTATTPTAFTATDNLTLFGVEGSNISYIRVYSCKIYDNNTLVRNMIPCYRVSDSVAGMYDTVNDVFYINSGTGTFTVGDDIPQYITQTGFWIDKVTNYGTYSYTATQGSESKTDNLTIDLVTEYDISITFSRLPSGFQEVEWIASPTTSGTYFVNGAYIDTGLVGQNIAMDFDVAYLTSNQWWTDSIGAGYNHNNGNQTYCLGLNYSNSNDYFFISIANSSSSGNTLHRSSKICTLGQKYNIKACTITNDTYLIVDDETLYSSSSETSYIYSAAKIVLFGTYEGYQGKVYWKASQKTYTFKIYSDADRTSLLRNFVPCYCTETVTAYQGSTQTTASANTIGLYDLIGSRFYINSGSGTFTKGDDV